jgi:hypothetical protein
MLCCGQVGPVMPQPVSIAAKTCCITRDMIAKAAVNKITISRDNTGNLAKVKVKIRVFQQVTWGFLLL